jgi:hypothetical protein
MSGKALSYLFLFVASLGLGVAVGEWFYHLFLQAVPPVALSQFNTQAARIAHWLYGAGVGVAMFVWAMIAIAINKLSSMGGKKAEDA